MDIDVFDEKFIQKIHDEIEIGNTKYIDELISKNIDFRKIRIKNKRIEQYIISFILEMKEIIYSEEPTFDESSTIQKHKWEKNHGNKKKISRSRAKDFFKRYQEILIKLIPYISINKAFIDFVVKENFKDIFIEFIDLNKHYELLLVSVLFHEKKFLYKEIVERNVDKLITKSFKELSLTSNKECILKCIDYEVNTIYIDLTYQVDNIGYLVWENQEKEIKELLGISSNIELIVKDEDTYVVRIYKKNKRAELIYKLEIENQKPQLVKIRNIDHSLHFFFKKIPGISIDSWNNKKLLIEDILGSTVDIVLCDKTHYLHNSKFYDDDLIIVKESSINTLTRVLNLDGIYSKFEIVDGYKCFYFSDVRNKDLWTTNKKTISKYLNCNINLYFEGTNVILKESVEEAIPRILELVDSSNKMPELLNIVEDGENRTYFYTFLPELDLNIWKERSRKKNFRVLFNEPNKVYKLDVYSQENKEYYNEQFYTGQLIMLHELAKIPAKEETKALSVDNLVKEKFFCGYIAGLKSYYVNINELSNLMIIGAIGSGKSNFMNGLILSLLKNISMVEKMYLIDLKAGIEFNRYKELESKKIEVFGRGTKPSRLLEALYEVEAEMYLREEYMASNNIVKIENDPIFVVIDEFAQIDLMYAIGEERHAKEEIFNLLLRVATRCRSANIKIILQTQDPRTIPEDLKKHLMSRVLLKTGKENDKDFTLQNSLVLDELGINHVNFDKGRYVFENYNNGNTRFDEIQFPYVDPEKKLHLHFKKESQFYSCENNDKYIEYSSYIKSEYPYLSNTRILDIDNTSSMKDEEVQENEIEDNTLSIKDTFDNEAFDFDSLLEEKDEIEDQYNEISKIVSSSQKLLNELNNMKED